MRRNLGRVAEALEAKIVDETIWFERLGTCSDHHIVRLVDLANQKIEAIAWQVAQLQRFAIAQSEVAQLDIMKMTIQS